MEDHKTLITSIAWVFPNTEMQSISPPVRVVTWSQRRSGRGKIKTKSGRTIKCTVRKTLSPYMNKICKDCKLSKNLEQFRCRGVNIKTGTSSFSACCKVCESKRSYKWFSEHHDKKIEYSRKNYQLHKEKHQLEARAKYYRNRAKILEQQKIY